jgi:hypothetical protein
MFYQFYSSDQVYPFAPAMVKKMRIALAKGFLEDYHPCQHGNR